MPRRLTERFCLGEWVEIRFGSSPKPDWLPGIVVRHEAPGLWVRDGEGRAWFVTNGRRIRPLVSGRTDAPSGEDELAAGAT